MLIAGVIPIVQDRIFGHVNYSFLFLMRTVIILMLILLQASFIYSQDYSAPVFRGELSEKYTYQITGSVYAYHDEFEKGNIIYNGKKYSGLMLNLNSHRNELQLKTDVSDDCIVLRRNLVGDFNIGERNYTSLYGENLVDGLPEGYYQVLYKGEKSLLLKKIYKNVSEQINSITGEITKVFVTKYSYFLVKERRVYKVKDYKGLTKFYKGDNNEIKAYLKERRKSGAARDDIMQGMMKIMEGRI